MPRSTGVHYDLVCQYLVNFVSRNVLHSYSVNYVIHCLKKIEV